MKPISQLIPCLMLLTVGCNAMQAKPIEKLVKDLDGDQIQDTVYVDRETSRIVCKLSSRNFEPIESLPIEILNYESNVNETDNGFLFFNHWMRAGYDNYFSYEPQTKRIRLVAMTRYEYGGYTNDGSGESSVNLLTNEYTGTWNHYDEELDELFRIPTIETQLPLPVTYLETFSEDTYFGYAEECAELYHQQVKHLESLCYFGFSAQKPFSFISSFSEMADSTSVIKKLIDSNKERFSGGAITCYKKTRLYGSDDDYILLEYDYHDGMMADSPWKSQFLFTLQGELLFVSNAFRFELIEIFPDSPPFLLMVYVTGKGNGHHALYRVTAGELENVYDGFSGSFPRTYGGHGDSCINRPVELKLTVKDVDEDGYNDLTFSGEIIFNQNGTVSENEEENIHIPVEYVFHYNPEGEYFSEQENYSEKYRPLREGIYPLPGK